MQTQTSIGIESLKDLYAALNRNDIPAAVAPLDPEIDWIEPAEYTGSKTCHGRAELEAHLTRARATWAEGTCEPERFFVAGDKVVVFLSIHVRLKTETAFREGRHAASTPSATAKPSRCASLTTASKPSHGPALRRQTPPQQVLP